MNTLVAILIALAQALSGPTAQVPVVVSPTMEDPYFSGHFGRPQDATALAYDAGCYEDEALVVVIAEVQPDDGVWPGLDWAPKGDLVGTLTCKTVDDIGDRP